MEAEQPKTTGRRALLLNCIVLSIGHCTGPLVARLYFLHGGNRVWLSSWLQTGGWPIILLPLTIAFLQRRKIDPTSKFFLMKLRLFVASAVIGVITGCDDYLYAYGVARLPVSTYSLIIASQLAFTAGFSFLLVKQKFTSYSINAVFLLTIGAGVLALHTSGDRPKGESTKEYVIGFLMMLGAAMLYGFILPLVELMYKKAKQEISYTLVLEIQMVMSVFATAFCTIGMIINNDFKVIGREAREFGLGESKYYTLVIITAMIWQCFFVGAIGVIFCGSSLLSGIIIAVLIPVIQILAVIFYRESFKAEKGVSLALSLWGFVSYFYGQIKQNKKKKKQTPKTEMPSPPNP
ncbi:hypothetical protein SLEP1_g20929 [Rubroshorea leprosula]|uniref:Probable purine permease n=1 Tax=Rubroshorea leprosula TaxID=152421 RepID=A0AAV5J478_9ROSI|nr:hypothetical protein SLEP1_g20929 [Rubroshorea leprosula]